MAKIILKAKPPRGFYSHLFGKLLIGNPRSFPVETQAVKAFLNNHEKFQEDYSFFYDCDFSFDKKLESCRQLYNYGNIVEMESKLAKYQMGKALLEVPKDKKKGEWKLPKRELPEKNTRKGFFDEH